MNGTQGDSVKLLKTIGISHKTVLVIVRLQMANGEYSLLHTRDIKKTVF